jgi:tetratricopeptide (TPR) repeat protein
MWDWLKAKAQQAANTYANHVQHAAVIQQVMLAPTYELSLHLLRNHLITLQSPEDFQGFLAVVGQLQMQAQHELQVLQHSGGGSTWGVSSEDRVAEAMAYVSSGQAMPGGQSQLVWQRLQALQQIAAHAQQLWSEIAAQRAQPLPEWSAGPVSAADQLNAFQAHLNAIAPISSVETRATSDGTSLDEIGAARKMIELDQRLMGLMARTGPGLADAAVVQGLHELAHGYADIANATEEGWRLVSRNEAVRKCAEAEEWMASALETLHDLDRACEALQEAEALYLDVGDHAQAESVRLRREEVEILQSGDADAEVRALMHRVESCPDPSVDRADALLSLGAMMLRLGETYSALESLHAAEAMLQDLGIQAPQGEAIVHDLLSTFSAILDGQSTGRENPLVDAMRSRGMYRSLWHNLARAYRASDPLDPSHADHLERAHHYLTMAEAQDSPGERKAFSETALGLQDDFQALLQRLTGGSSGTGPSGR